MNEDPRGTIIQTGNVMRINNAFVEEVSCHGADNFLIISYAVPEADRSVSIQNIRLNINRNTTILNVSGRIMNLCDLRKGMRVNAIFSSRMTRSIPPQSNAFLIIVLKNQTAPVSVTTDRIASVDTANNALYTGNPRDINTQTRFNITKRTLITDRSGRPIRLNMLRPGQLVKITHANTQTASIPPQTTAFHIQLL